MFAMLGTLMFVSKLLMEVLPNIHLLAMFTVLYTVVYRRRALVPIYLFVILTGLYGGFAMWWIPHLYLWTILWGVTMLLPRQMPKKVACVVYPVVCALHGLAFGTLYAPAQALLFGLSFDAMVAWIIAGLPWDFIHGISNFFCGMLIVPIITVLHRMEQNGSRD